MGPEWRATLALIGWAGLASCGLLLDPSIPELTLVEPAEGQSQVATNALVRLSFDHPMQKDRCEKAFRVSAEGASLDGVFAWNGNTMTFRPTPSLVPGARHLIELGSEAVDTRGMRLGVHHRSSFQVGSTNAPPTVLLVSPAVESTSNRRPRIALRFSRAMREKSVEEAFSLSPDPGGRFAWSNASEVSWELKGDLAWFTEYVVRVAKTALDVDGLPLEREFRAAFTCGNFTPPPAYLGAWALGDARLPLSLRFFGGESNHLSRDGALVFHFNREMDEESFRASLSLAPPVSGKLVQTNFPEGWCFLFTPDAPLAALTRFQYTIPQVVKDTLGLMLGTTHTGSFLTDTPDSLPPSVAAIETAGGSAWEPGEVNRVAGVSNTLELFIRWNVAVGAAMDGVSVEQSANIVRFAGDAGARGSMEGTFRSWSWDATSTRLTLGLANLAPGQYYRLRFAGGAFGTRDDHSNAMPADSVWIFCCE